MFELEFVDLGSESLVFVMLRKIWGVLRHETSMLADSDGDLYVMMLTKSE
jgi:hypothetical protein